ncbi:predicted protein [Uncinocarpus reesii 1704]|uniref:Uncharacterized protein n=1 Tax=Uncinocarpus reesii (strain UAMH 1704) TaxID=336963 RepID=C4JY06_UNCRE|nr:uncharacterized protein UREG_07057 [Uncinocarpus reesii 1704]EEP82192.1 predicted protein [Uncinocarpus reesii 1704]
MALQLSKSKMASRHVLNSLMNINTSVKITSTVVSSRIPSALPLPRRCEPRQASPADARFIFHYFSTSDARRVQSTKACLQVKTLEDSRKILAAQRLKRPVAPHIAIYKWQISAVLSSLERLTGMAFSGGLYLFGIAYVLSPYLGWGLSAASMATAFGALPLAAKVAAKFTIAWPFVFHCLNGVKCVVWSSGKFLTNQGVKKTGMLTVGAATIGAIALAFFV